MGKKDKLYLRKAKAYNALAIGYLIGGEDELAKKAVCTMIVFSRLRAREAVKRCIEAETAFDAAMRTSRLRGFNSDIPDEERNQMEQFRLEYKRAKNELENIGHELSRELRSWEMCGATFQELCNLCNRDYEQVVKGMRHGDVGRPFDLLVSGLLLDYKAPRGDAALDMGVDAPLTHAILEFQVHALLEMPGLNEKVGEDMMKKLTSFSGMDFDTGKE